MQHVPLPPPIPSHHKTPVNVICIPFPQSPDNSINRAQQLRLQNILPLLVLLRALKCLIVLPPHRLLALPAVDIPDYVPPCCHVALDGFGLRDVNNGVEEVGFAMLAAEILNREGEI